jgi:hypothetical protein
VAVVVVIVLAVIGSLSSGHHPASPAAPAAAATADPDLTAAPTPTAAPVPAPLTLTTSVTRKRPFVGTKVGVTVSTSPGVRITAVAHFPVGNIKRTIHADASGLHTFWYPAASALLGYRAYVTIRAYLHGQKQSSRVWFTPRLRPPPPAPKPAPSSPPQHGSGAWCTASASYNAQYSDYDVYVHSNQPNQSATATASNGKSFSYNTDDSGYADIYLYADPGNSITVTVGAASCSTSA